MKKQWLLVICIAGLVTGSLLANQEETAASGILEKARVKLALKQYDQAMALLEQGRREDPRNTGILNLMGMVYLQEGKYDLARKQFKRALKLEEGNAKVLNNLGSTYHLAKDYKSAIRQYRKAIKADPAYLTAYYNLSSACFAVNDDQGAMDALEELVKLDPAFLSRDRSALAVEAPEGKGEPYKLFLVYARVYARGGQADLAVDYLKKCLANGMKDLSQLRQDQDFASLQSDPDFQALIGG